MTGALQALEYRIWKRKFTAFYYVDLLYGTDIFTQIPMLAPIWYACTKFST